MTLLFLYFFIAHLLGDFLFQTSAIVAWKQKSSWGIAFHVAIIFFTSVVVLLPYLNNWQIIVAIILNAVVHYAVDAGKIWYEQNTQNSPVLRNFWIDQIMHIATFGTIVLIIGPMQAGFFTDTWWFEFYQQTNLILYTIGFLLFSYMIDIIYFIHQLHRGEYTPYSRSYYSMIVHTFAFACVFICAWYVYLFVL